MSEVAAEGQHHEAQVVDHVVHPGQVARHLAGHYDQRDQADRHVDVEDPAPGQVVHEHPAEQRADHAGQAEDRAEQADVAATFPGRDHVADDGLRADHQTACAQALERAERDQHDHGRADAGQDRAGHEDDDGRLEEDLPAVLVTQLAPERGGHREGQQVRGDHPGDVRAAMEVADDGRQRGGHDRLVERGEQHAEHERADDEQDAAAAEPGLGAVASAIRGERLRAAGLPGSGGSH